MVATLFFLTCAFLLQNYIKAKTSEVIQSPAIYGHRHTHTSQLLASSVK